MESARLGRAQVWGDSQKAAYNITLSDWFNLRVIHEVQRSGNRIFVQAGDNLLCRDIDRPVDRKELMPPPTISQSPIASVSQKFWRATPAAGQARSGSQNW